MLSWQAASADDTIEPGLDLKFGLGIDAYSDEKVELRYILDARGLDTRPGLISVTWPEGQEEPRVWPRYGPGLPT